MRGSGRDLGLPRALGSLWGSDTWGSGPSDVGGMGGLGIRDLGFGYSPWPCYSGVS